jgi:hypothetical protein
LSLSFGLALLRPVESWNFWLRQSPGIEKSC